jgi:C_GCAxxG_C_C family probable redox protein
MNERIPAKSKRLFASGYYCAESVLLAMAESHGIQSDLIPCIASGFCSGMARTGGPCGAVSGAMMGISLIVGRRSSAEGIDRNYTLIRELIRRFEEQFGSANCGTLLGCDLGTPEGLQAFQTNQLRKRCADYVEAATRIAISLLEENDRVA